MSNLIVLCSTCGVGKSTICEYLNEQNLLKDCACIDTDEVGINWWDYAGTENESKFSDDCIKEAVRMADGKNVLFVTCMNPYDFYGKVNIPSEISATYFIAMTCSDEEVAKRLKARPEERMCGSDEFIQGQIQYNQWFRNNHNKFQFYIDNTELTVDETAHRIADYVNCY